MTDTTLTRPLTRNRVRLPIVYWFAVWRSRRALLRLEPHMLRDIGMTDTQAAREAARPMWDAPTPWRQVG